MPFSIRDNVAASHLLSAIFDWFNENQILYCVQRNYQGYPEKITGDVDLVVRDGQVFIAIEWIQDAAKQTGWDCYLQYAWDKTAYLGFYQPNYPSRFTLTIELFAGARWHGVPYLTSSEILARRIKYGTTWRPHPVHQATITIVHHLLYNSQVPQKYRQEVFQLIQDDLDLFRQSLAQSFGFKFAQQIVDNVVQQKWDLLANKVHTYQIALLFRALKAPISLLMTLIGGFTAKRKTPEGVVLIVEGNESDLQTALCDQLLKLAVKWHIFVPPTRKIFLCSEKRLTTNQHQNAQRILRGGGVVIINSQEKCRLNLNNIFPSYLIQYKQETCIVEAINSSGKVLKSSEVSDFLDELHLSYQIWDFILANRAELVTVGRSSSG